MDFYELFCLWCSNVGKKPATVAQEVGLTKGTPTNWKNRHSTPPLASQIVIADYFGVSLDDFREGPKKEKPTIPQDDGLTSIPFDDLSGEQVVTRFLKKLPTKALYELLEETTKELKRRNDD